MHDVKITLTHQSVIAPFSLIQSYQVVDEWTRSASYGKLHPLRCSRYHEAHSDRILENSLPTYSLSHHLELAAPKLVRL